MPETLPRASCMAEPDVAVPEIMALAPRDDAVWRPLSLPRVIRHFAASRRAARIETYLAEASALLPDEKILLFFLHTIFSGSMATIQLYARYIVAFLNHAEKPFHTVTHLDADAYLRSRAAEGAKPTTINTIAAALKSFYRHLSDARILPHNPTAFLKKKREARSRVLPGHLSHSLGEKELEILFRGLERCRAPQRDQALFILLFMTGLRAEELVRLTWKDLLEWQGQWYLDILGKGAKARRVYVPARALQALLRYREEIYGAAPSRSTSAIADLPLLGHIRRPKQRLTRHGVYRLVKKWCTALLGKGEVSPHWFRHTCFTQLAHKGVALEAIKALAGHESLETTMRYNEAAALMEPAGRAFEKE